MIGVGKFKIASAGFWSLPFSVEYAGQLASALRDYQLAGFEVQLLENPGRQQIQDAWMGLLDDGTVDARVVHVISHGRLSAQQRRVEVVGQCTLAGTNNVWEWVSAAHDSGVPTLFLVDLCGAGKAADLDFLVEPQEGDLKTWVLAASRADERAFDGVFTRAVTRVLRECGRDGLGAERRRPYVDLAEFGRRVQDRMSKPPQKQTLRSTKIDSHWSTPGILPNPLYTPDPWADRVAALEPSMQPIVADVVADLGHFHGRAGAWFTGRHSVLGQLVPWLSGTGTGGLWVVTGAAGSGKSALLGALVCAAHPALEDLAGSVRRRMDEQPEVIEGMVAVHARQRSLTEIIDSVGRQLGLTVPDKGWDAADLITAIAGLPEPPVIVVDALDECPQAAAVQAVLLMPLAVARRSDDRSAVRLLVGTRPWPEFHLLLDRATQSGRLSDLDQTTRPELYRDLRRFLLDQFHQMPAGERLANGIATVLADHHEEHRGDPAAKKWGHFLVAARYATYVLDNPPADNGDVERLIGQVPVTLPQILEMELAEHPRPHHLRAALTALAYAKGTGMPVELLRAITPAVGPADPDLFTSDDLRLYIRAASEDSGVSLLRLYHQGLADYLREHPITADEEHDLTAPVTTALLATRDRGDGRRSWQHAPPYLHRHAIEHAADADLADPLLEDYEYLTFAHTNPLLQFLDLARSDKARLGAAVYRSAYHLLKADPEQRRRLIHLTYLRYTSGAATRVSPAEPRP